MSRFTDTVCLDGFDLTVVSNGEAIVAITRGKASNTSPDALTDRAILELREYFAGERKSFTVPVSLEDAKGATVFRRRVWKELMSVPYGESVSYGSLAKRIGKENASRAVGGAVGANELLIMVPCHRVIASDGSIGGFSAGIDLKKLLLKIEKTSGIL